MLGARGDRQCPAGTKAVTGHDPEDVTKEGAFDVPVSGALINWLKLQGSGQP